MVIFMSIYWEVSGCLLDSFDGFDSCENCDSDASVRVLYRPRPYRHLSPNTYNFGSFIRSTVLITCLILIISEIII